MAQLLQGVGGVGHQLADEDLAVGVEGVDDDVQQLADFGLKRLVGDSIGAHNILFEGERGWKKRAATLTADDWLSKALVHGGRGSVVTFCCIFDWYFEVI